MSVMSMISNLISQVNDAKADSSQTSGMSAADIDLLEQVITLIKVLVSDGIQKGEATKLTALMGQLVESFPDMADEVGDITKALNKLEKKLEQMDPSTGLNLDSKKNSADLSDMMNQEIGERGVLSDESRLDEFDSVADLALKEEEALNAISDPQLAAILEETRIEREDIALSFIDLAQDHIFLSQANVDKISQTLGKIANLGSINNND